MLIFNETADCDKPFTKNVKFSHPILETCTTLESLAERNANLCTSIFSHGELIRFMEVMFDEFDKTPRTRLRLRQTESMF